MSLENEYKLSVVLLVYNTEEFLEECLDSLVNQTLDDMEIICVNDESTDSSLNILRQYERKYDNIKVIDQKNTGGAIAGNNGLKMAKGEYVAILDSDDIVVEDAYEKLYNKAKETDSDIVSGKPFVFENGIQRTVSVQHDMWDEEKTVDIEKDLKIFYDVFYWDKIYRRSFVEENDIYMIPGKLYADAPMVFKAYLNAEKITFIPDFVYYWRKRESNESITKSLTNVKNTKDRLDNYYVIRDYFKENPKLFNKVIKLYFERFLFPMKGIASDPEFKKIYLEDLRKILDDTEDIYDNEFIHMKFKFYIYLVLNNQTDLLEEFMENHEDSKDMLVEDGKSYWNLKYFRNPKYDIPDEMFEIRNIHGNFINVNDMRLDSDNFYVNISLPPTLKMDKVRIRFNGLTKKYGDKEKNSQLFELDFIKDGEYSLKLPLSEIKNPNYYDVHLDVVYNGKRETYRLGEKNFINAIDEDSWINKKGQLLITTYKNLSYIHGYVENIFKFDLNNERFRILSVEEESPNYDILLAHKRKNENVYFTNILEKPEKLSNEFEMKWKYSLDKNITYKLFTEISEEKYELTSDCFIDYKDQEIDYEDGKIKLFKDENDSLYLKWETND